MAATPNATLYREDGYAYGDLGVWVAATGGNFEILVQRPDYGAPQHAAQVDSETREALRPIPSEYLAGWRGLDDFFVVVLRNAAGRRVARAHLPFCPNGEGQRLDDTGPAVPTYPPFCGSSFPFTRAMVWGIDDHWATNPLGGSDEYDGEVGFRVREGRYTARMWIRAKWADLFEIPEADRAVTVNVTVKTRRWYEGARVTAAAERESASVVPTVTDPDAATLPDLAATPAWDIGLYRTRRGYWIGFAANVWNAGPAPLIVEGFRRPGEDVMDAFQYYQDASGAIVGRTPAGTFEWDARRGHDHWHFLQFATYRLLDADTNEVVRSGKQAFCIVPTDPIDVTLTGAAWRSGLLELHSQCGSRGSLWIREHLPVGWGDTYYQGIPGQALRATGLPNGRYELQVVANPLGVLREADDATKTNNTSSRFVVLRTRRDGSRAMRVEPIAPGFNP